MSSAVSDEIVQSCKQHNSIEDAMSAEGMPDLLEVLHLALNKGDFAAKQSGRADAVESDLQSCRGVHQPAMVPP